MIDNFQNCLNFVLQMEGGWSNDPVDPGGATMQGIIQVEYNAFRDNHGLPRQSVRLISQSERDSIYKIQYWNAVMGDLLPKGIDLMVFDEGVNSGPIRAIKDLQMVLGVAQDGQLGLITLTALRKASVKTLIVALSAKRLGFLRGLKTWWRFGKGWKSRVYKAQQVALQMIAQ